MATNARNRKQRKAHRRFALLLERVARGWAPASGAFHRDYPKARKVVEHARKVEREIAAQVVL